MSSSFEVDTVLDTEDAFCPIPVMMAREAIGRLKVGGVLKVISRDPAAKKDIPVWVRRSGNALLGVEEEEEEGGRLTFYIRKGGVGISPRQDEELYVATKGVEHLRIDLRDGVKSAVETGVAVEVPVNIRVNGREVVTLMATPTHIEELATGYLLDEGVIERIDQVRSLEIRGADVDVEVEGDVEDRVGEVERASLITSECVSLEHYLRLIGSLKMPIVNSSYTVQAGDIGRMVKEFNLHGEADPGGIHSTALFEDGRMKYYMIDVSRHSAVDKVLGAGAKDKVDFKRCVIITSGRQPAGMVLKAARMNIPISASTRGPIYSGVLAAQRTGITLICYVRVTRLDVYSAPERIAFP